MMGHMKRMTEDKKLWNFLEERGGKVKEETKFFWGSILYLISLSNSSK